MELARHTPGLIASASTLLTLWCLWRGRRERVAHLRALAALENTNLTLQRIRQAVEGSSDAVGIGDMESNSLYHNPAHVALFGYSVEELNNNPEPAALFADKSVAFQIHSSIRAGRSWVGETDIKTKDGRIIPASVRADIIRDEQGKPVGIFGGFTDITEQRRVMRLLSEQKQRLQVTLENTSDAIITTDSAGHVVVMNPAAEQLLGLGREQAAGRFLADILHVRDETTHVPRELPLMLLLRRPWERHSADAYLHTLPDSGAERVIAETSALIVEPDASVAGAVLVLRDVTSERRKSEEVARAERLEALGLLSGSVAHDFGNLLTAMSSQLYVARLAGDLPEKTSAKLDELEATIWRASDLTRQLTSFSRKEKAVRQPVNLRALLEESLRLAVEGRRVEGRLECATDLPPIPGDATRLVQLFNNLCVNAVQAMPAGGLIGVKATELPPDDGALPMPGDRFVRILFSDTGSGIAPEHLARIFDPFFTTKEGGHGLGLATCYSVVKLHGGRIRAESEPGRGTTFEVLLPVV